jgi:hypothetical protein
MIQILLSLIEEVPLLLGSKFPEIIGYGLTAPPIIRDPPPPCLDEDYGLLKTELFGCVMELDVVDC